MPSQDKTDKQRVLSLVQDLPDNTSYDEVLRELAFVRMVDRGLADAQGDRHIDSKELKERIRAWQA